MMESEKGAIAIHCKAGLGRAGTMSALYIMKHYGFTAAEAIGWLRVTRPGSIIGPQQHYLASMQQTMWAEGEEYRRRNPGTANAGMGDASVDKMSNQVSGLSISSQRANSSSTEKSQGDFLRSRRSPQNASRR